MFFFIYFFFYYTAFVFNEVINEELFVHVRRVAFLWVRVERDKTSQNALVQVGWDLLRALGIGWGTHPLLLSFFILSIITHFF